jgi:phosphopentomutase
MTDCGNAGLGSGNRDDLTTFNHAINILDQHHPNVMLINFKEPDVSGHANNWPNYLKGIVTTDFYCNEIWNHLQSDPKYKDVTTLIITNDHGRHLNDYTSHGDNCSGCRHIECLVVGPEIKANYTDTTTYSQVDIGVTAGALLKIDMLNVEGRTMKNIFK